MTVLLSAFVLLPNAHAHNDYAHPHPLLDALEQGFLSVEADIFLVDGELRVGHNRQDLKPGRTLEALYLDPLLERVKKNHGTVYGQPGTLILLVDIKEDGASVQAELNRRLPAYKEMLVRRDGNRVGKGAIEVILSGARTEDCADQDGYLFKDGRLKNLTDDAARTPLISEDYADVTGTNASPLPKDVHAKLLQTVSEVHRNHKRFRLWGTPDAPSAWGELESAKLDLINTDRLADLRAFLLKREN